MPAKIEAHQRPVLFDLLCQAREALRTMASAVQAELEGTPVSGLLNRSALHQKVSFCIQQILRCPCRSTRLRTRPIFGVCSCGFSRAGAQASFIGAAPPASKSGSCRWPSRGGPGARDALRAGCCGSFRRLIPVTYEMPAPIWSLYSSSSSPSSSSSSLWGLGGLPLDRAFL